MKIKILNSKIMHKSKKKKKKENDGVDQKSTS